MKPQIVFETSLPAGLKKTDFELAAKTVLKHLNKDISGQIHLSFASKEQSASLNLKHAKNDYATDVLSFVYPQPSPAEVASKLPQVAAEIVICTPIAQQQATEYGLDLNQESTLLFVHGMLHILDYDHQTKTEQTGFSELQNAIMNTLGLKSRKMLWLH